MALMKMPCAVGSGGTTPAITWGTASFNGTPMSIAVSKKARGISLIMNGEMFASVNENDGQGNSLYRSSTGGALVAKITFSDSTITSDISLAGSASYSIAYFVID